MAATLKDIAEHLNLSISTVSYALNGGPKPVSETVRGRVLQKAEELGYRPNRLARSLVTRRTHTLGVIPVGTEEDILLYPTVHLALNGLFNAAVCSGQDLMIFTAHDWNSARASAHDLLDSRVDGVIFVCPHSDSLVIREISQSGLPFAIVGNSSISPHFTLDNVAGALMAMRHLYDLGHRRIAHVAGDFHLEDAVIRQQAFLDFMSGHHLEVPDCYVYEGDYRHASGYSAGLKFLDLNPRPTAVFCANDGMACGFLEAIASKGLECPRDISVIGFDDAAPGDVVLSSIRQPVGDMAVAALEALLRFIDSGVAPASRQFEPSLVVRASTAPVS
jgi:DNA-binding LacI/PurR family transcriptional regulator